MTATDLQKILEQLQPTLDDFTYIGYTEQQLRQLLDLIKQKDQQTIKLFVLQDFLEMELLSRKEPHLTTTMIYDAILRVKKLERQINMQGAFKELSLLQRIALKYHTQVWRILGAKAELDALQNQSKGYVQILTKWQLPASFQADLEEEKNKISQIRIIGLYEEESSRFER